MRPYAEELLEVEVLGGPRDGEVVVLRERTEWGGHGTGSLAFPLDEALGSPEGCFVRSEEGWWFERPGRERIRVSAGDMLRGGGTQLWVRQAG